jgi:hypothetical protein
MCRPLQRDVRIYPYEVYIRNFKRQPIYSSSELCQLKSVSSLVHVSYMLPLLRPAAELRGWWITPLHIINTPSQFPNTKRNITYIKEIKSANPFYSLFLTSWPEGRAKFLLYSPCFHIIETATTGELGAKLNHKLKVGELPVGPTLLLST